MKTRILIFLVLIMIWPSFADDKENDPILEFVLFYQAADTSIEHFWEAYSDLEHHTRSASKYFGNSQFKIVTKEENQQDWHNLIPKKPFGFVVLYGKKSKSNTHLILTNHNFRLNTPITSTQFS